MDAPVKTLTPVNAEKAKALQVALAQIEKQFGKGTIMRLGEGEVIEDIQVVSTGSLGLDIALGVGGLPRGRVVEIYGPESSGKTTLTLQVIAEMQKTGGQCAFVDAEHALDIQYAQNLGVNLQDLLISQPDTGEQALEIVDSLVRSGAVDLIVVDSVAVLVVVQRAIRHRCGRGHRRRGHDERRAQRRRRGKRRTGRKQQAAFEHLVCRVVARHQIERGITADAPRIDQVHRERAGGRGGRDIDRRDRLFEARRVDRLADRRRRHPGDKDKAHRHLAIHLDPIIHHRPA